MALSSVLKEVRHNILDIEPLRDQIIETIKAHALDEKVRTFFFLKNPSSLKQTNK